MTLSDRDLEGKILTLRLADLQEQKTELSIELQNANTQIGMLELKIVELEDGSKVLAIKLEDANNEIGRLMLVVKHQTDAEETFQQRGTISMSDVKIRKAQQQLVR